MMVRRKKTTITLCKTIVIVQYAAAVVEVVEVAVVVANEPTLHQVLKRKAYQRNEEWQAHPGACFDAPPEVGVRVVDAEEQEEDCIL
jgi:hypothetical protein